MKLRGNRFLTDENIHAEVVSFLRSEGCGVLDVKEEGLDGSDDLSLIRLSVAEARVVLTHDSDFGTLALAAQEPILGIVYLRPGHTLPESTACRSPLPARFAYSLIRKLTRSRRSSSSLYGMAVR